LKVTSNAAFAAIIGGGLCGLASKLWTFPFRMDLIAVGISVLLLASISFIENRLTVKKPLF